MYYHTCPDCGANLDPGERCDCLGQKKIGLPDANQTSPKTDGKSSSTNNITQIPWNVNSNLLQLLRTGKGIPAKELVWHVQRRYPKYDKTLHSKCERGEIYGIQLRQDAMDALIRTFAPDVQARIKYVRGGCHKRSCRVYCRLDESDYNQFLEKLRKDGFSNKQDAIEHLIKNYIGGKQ